MAISLRKQRRIRRHGRIRARIFGTSEVPRLCIFKSVNHIYCQLIDDEKGKTLLSASDLEIKKSKTKKTNEDKKGAGSKAAVAYEVGKLIAKKAQEKKIKKVIFDRGGFTYHGRIKSLADGAREGGLIF